MDELHDLGPPLSASTPNVARIYDALLGGKDNFPADREAAQRLMRLMPDVKAAAQLNRAFLKRAVRRLTHAGITQYIDLGSGLPTQENVHEVAQAVNPNAKVVYVDHDPVPVTHGRAILKGTGVVMLHADIRQPLTILHDPVVRDTIDYRQPVALIAVAVLHFLADPHEVLRCFADRLAPGSRLVLSHGTSDGADPRTVAEGKSIYKQTSAPVYPRPAAEIAAMLEAFGTVDEPGLVPVTDWHPDPEAFPPAPVPWLLVGTATKPPGTT
ncbi:S-adenosyl methyltransferase [Sinosporangium album]|uniref:S-adenosyl methyltransferase n=1 Tax=Sinosporangium album TaxID=504805 RepID=A0A1G8EEZ7_9ACTN|nr:SAM-dependent methyltransferase [Sinosporangium album]SDH68466.1 S-adenosyl methyltransferase [Sinosporangium album]